MLYAYNFGSVSADRFDAVISDMTMPSLSLRVSTEMPLVPEQTGPPARFGAAMIHAARPSRRWNIPGTMSTEGEKDL